MILKEDVDDEAFKQTAWDGLDEGWHDHLPEDFDHEGFDAENYNEIIEREYPTGQSGYNPGMKDLRRSQYNHYESPEENEKRFRDLMDNPTREPILVVRDKNGEEHIIAGHHRMAANMESGRPHLPALILDMNKDIQTGEPMDIAMRLLKVDLDYSTTHTTGPLRNQQELGEWDANFPSTHGPVTMARIIPSSGAEEAKRQGLVPRGSDTSNRSWETQVSGRRGATSFDLSKPGIWTRPANIAMTYNYPYDPREMRSGRQTMIGIRGDPTSFAGQFREGGNTREPAEAYLSQTIPPEQLVHNLPEEALSYDPTVWPQQPQGENYWAQTQTGTPVQTGTPMDIVFQLLKASVV